MHWSFLLIILFLWVGPGAGTAAAKPVIRTQDRLEINWSTLRIRFFGEAKVDPQANDFKATEKKAWRDGLQYVTGAVRDLHITANESLVRDTKRLGRDAGEAAKTVATSTFSYNTTYFGDGTVRVHLENLLPKALATSAVRFHQREALEPGMIEYTGVVFETDKDFEPRALYHVVDENGAILFDVADMAREAYEKNLMGRWFREPGPAELSPAVGKNPLIIKASVAGEGRLRVSKEAWEKAVTGHLSLLRSGRIAIALP